MLVSAPGVVVLTNPSDIEMLVGRIMGDLKARGYGRSELTDLQVSQIGEPVACVSVNRVRYKTDGQELERLGETYMLRNSDGGWKIVVATIHDPGIILRAA
jgi:ketosteroid isomerase-like protein